MDYRKIARGLTVEHWSDKDIDSEGIPTSRYWKQAGVIRQAFPYNAYTRIIKQSWKWRIRLMLRMKDGTINNTEIELKHGIPLRDMDQSLKHFRDEMLAEFPDYDAIGWRATILGAP